MVNCAHEEYIGRKEARFCGQCGYELPELVWHPGQVGELQERYRSSRSLRGFANFAGCAGLTALAAMGAESILGMNISHLAYETPETFVDGLNFALANVAAIGSIFLITAPIFSAQERDDRMRCQRAQAILEGERTGSLRR